MTAGGSAARIARAFNPNLSRCRSIDSGLTCGDVPGRGCGFWLREPDRDGGSEQVEGAGLDRGRGGDLLDLLAVEIDDLPGQCRQLAEQDPVAVKGQAVGCFLGGVLCRGPG